MELITHAKAEFSKIENCSCIIISETYKITYKSSDKGIKPLIEAVHLIKDSVVADKIIGKAAALICAYGGAKGVYGGVMSTAAKAILAENNIDYDCGQTTDSIINRQGTDICPMEKLVAQINSPKDAYEIISNKIAR